MSKPTLYSNNVQPRGVLENLQDALIRRFGKSAKPIEPILYEFTNDKALLHQYFVMRERMLGTDRFLPKDVLPQDLHDKISHILIARRGKLCIGGGRLTIREGDEMFPLPMETDEFKLRNLFPQLPLDKERHAVGSKFAIHDDHKNSELLYAMCKIMHDKVIASGIRYYFVRATNITLARNWRLIFNTLLPKSTRICTEIDVPDSPFYPGQKQYLVFTDLTSVVPPAAQSESWVPSETVAAPYLALVD